jgi:integrase
MYDRLNSCIRWRDSIRRRTLVFSGLRIAEACDLRWRQVDLAAGRIMARTVERANEKLTDRGSAPLPDGLTPHSLRRTFISLLLAVGEEVTYVMRQVGHADPKVTLAIYAQVMFRGEGERERLKALVEGSDWALLGTGANLEAVGPGEQLSLEALKPGVAAGASKSGRSWTRTRDLFLIREAL